jgi:hypothetical protein
VAEDAPVTPSPRARTAASLLLAAWGGALLRPSPAVVRAAAGTDVLHALSMLAAAGAWPGYRRPALTSAALAAASALATAAGRTARRSPLRAVR